MSNFLPAIPKNDANAEAAKQNAMDRVPTMGILQPSNPVCIEKELSAGVFYDYENEESFGKSMIVVPIAQRYQVRYYHGDRNNKDYKETVFLLDGGTPWAENKIIAAKDNEYKGHFKEKAVDYLVFLPELNRYAHFWCKGTLDKPGFKLWEQRHTNQNYSPVRIYTDIVKTEKFSWFVFKSEQLSGEVKFPENETKRALEIFNDVKVPELDQAKATTDASQRKR